MRIKEVKIQYANLIVSIADKVATVTFNRPGVLNATNSAMCKDIASACGELNANEDVKVVIFTGVGRAFIAGADVSEMQPLDSVGAIQFLGRFREATGAIENMDKPSIAAVNGYAFGGGNEIALACDIRIAADGASFGQQEINLGVIPGAGATQRLPRLVGYGQAMEMILSGSPINAQEAYRIGMVNRVVPGSDLTSECLRLAQTIAQKGKFALSQAKKAVRASRSLNLQSGLDFELQCSSLTWSTDDQKRLMKEFLEKRGGGK